MSTATRITAILAVLACSAAAPAVAAAPIVGTDGNDTITGTDAGERIRALAGDDTAHGKAGRDRIFGHDGNDTLRGGDHGDIAWGGRGNDTIFAQRGRDRVFGGPDNDTLWALARADVNGPRDRRGDFVHGGSGDDTIRVRDGERDRVTCGPGTDTVIADHRDRIARGCETVQRAAPSTGEDESEGTT